MSRKEEVKKCVITIAGTPKDRCIYDEETGTYYRPDGSVFDVFERSPEYLTYTNKQKFFKQKVLENGDTQMELPPVALDEDNNEYKELSNEQKIDMKDFVRWCVQFGNFFHIITTDDVVERYLSDRAFDYRCNEDEWGGELIPDNQVYPNGQIIFDGNRWYKPDGSEYVTNEIHPTDEECVTIKLDEIDEESDEESGWLRENTLKDYVENGSIPTVLHLNKQHLFNHLMNKDWEEEKEQ